MKLDTTYLFSYFSIIYDRSYPFQIFLYKYIFCNNFSPTVSMLKLFNSNIFNENTYNVNISDNFEIALELLSNE
jgi:hypothetical protein